MGVPPTTAGNFFDAAYSIVFQEKRRFTLQYALHDKASKGKGKLWQNIEMVEIVKSVELKHNNNTTEEMSLDKMFEEILE